MFLNHERSVGLVEATAAQAMLQNVSRDELKSEFIVPSIIPGVDVLPAQSMTLSLLHAGKSCAEHLPQQNVHAVLYENVVAKLKKTTTLSLLTAAHIWMPS